MHNSSVGTYRMYLKFPNNAVNGKLIISAVTLMLCLTPGIRANASDVAIPNQPWPQYCNMAPLPGAGIALNSDGHADGVGAIQMNIPVAYTPGSGFANLSAYAGNYCNGNRENFGNGTGVLGFGLGNKDEHRVYFSAMQVSRDIVHEAKAVNCQVLLFDETNNRPSVSFGIQDILHKEPDGKSYYCVATKCLSVKGKSVYASLGYGNGRFLDDPFAGLSIPIGEKYNLITEYDGFQLNAGLSYRPSGRFGKATLLGGYNGKSGWIAGIGTGITFGSHD